MNLRYRLLGAVTLSMTLAGLFTGCSLLGGPEASPTPEPTPEITPEPQPGRVLGGRDAHACGDHADADAGTHGNAHSVLAVCADGQHDL